jgi:3-methyladenine DNA glycosylase Mpg
LTGNDLFIEDHKENFDVIKTTRIGLSKGKEKLLRFYIKDNEFVSRK